MTRTGSSVLMIAARTRVSYSFRGLWMDAVGR